MLKNSFVNLAVPSMVLCNPGDPRKMTLPDDVPEGFRTTTVWSKWEVHVPQQKLRENLTLRGFFELLWKQFKLKALDLSYKSKPLYISALYQLPGKEAQKKDKLDELLIDWLQDTDEQIEPKWIKIYKENPKLYTPLGKTYEMMVSFHREGDEK